MSPEQFFNSYLNDLIIYNITYFLGLKGTIHFTVEHAGSWTISFGDYEAPIQKGCVGYADLTVWQSSKCFAATLTDELDAKAMIRDRQMYARGDISLLHQLGEFIGQSSNKEFRESN